MSRKHIYASQYLGQKINRLTILSLIDLGTRNTMVNAVCECGIIQKYELTTIVSGHTKSCGCLQKETVAEICKKSKTHGLRHHPLYGIWCNIKGRCYNEKNIGYYLYGGRGVKMCDEWKNDFKPFYDWCIKNGWRKGLEIDKDIKSEGKLSKIYSPEYCSIVTPLENSRSKRTTKFVVYNGDNISIQELGERFNISYKLMWKRFKKGWDIEKLISPPQNKKNKAA